MPQQVVRAGYEGNTVEEREPAQVRRALEDFVLEGSSSEALGAPGRESGAHMLTRMANQSLLADMCAVLQDFLLRPELGMAVAVQEMTFRIDVAELRLDADAIFRVSTVSGAPQAPEHSDGADARLVLGSLRGSATVCLDRDHAASGAEAGPEGWPRGALNFVFHRPSLNMITEAMLEATAAVLATERLTEECMFQNQDTDAGSDPESQPSVFGDLLDRVAPDAVHGGEGASIHDEREGSRGGARIGQRVVQGLVGALGGFVGAGSSN